MKCLIYTNVPDCYLIAIMNEICVNVHSFIDFLLLIPILYLHLFFGS